MPFAALHQIGAGASKSARPVIEFGGLAPVRA